MLDSYIFFNVSTFFFLCCFVVVVSHFLSCHRNSLVRFTANLTSSERFSTGNQANREQRPLTGVLAAELDRRVAHVGHALAMALIAQIHTVGVTVAAPTHGNAQAVHSTLELIHMAAAWWTCGCG